MDAFFCVFVDLSEKNAVILFSPVLHQLIQVLLHVLEDKVQLIVLSDDLLQLHHIGMVQLLQ